MNYMNKEFMNIRKLRRELGEKEWAKYQSKRNVLKVMKWRRNVKKKLIKYKGGKCEKCGYNKEIPCAYDFHHKGNENKDFNITAKTKSFETLKNEVDKCLLLCANCHREIHQVEYDKLFSDNVKKRENEIILIRRTKAMNYAPLA